MLFYTKENKVVPMLQAVRGYVTNNTIALLSS